MLSSRLADLSWKLAAFTAMTFVTQSTIRFFAAISLYEEYMYLYAAIELVNIGLGGWFFFTFFATADGTGIVTKPDDTADTLLLRRVWSLLYLVAMIRFVLYSSGDLVEGKTHYLDGRVPVQVVLIISAVLMAVSGVMAWSSFPKRVKVIPTPGLEGVVQRNLRATRPLKKLRKNLDEHEIAELSRLLYESKRLRETSLASVAKFVFLVFVWALVLDILTELVARVLR